MTEKDGNTQVSVGPTRFRTRPTDYTTGQASGFQNLVVYTLPERIESSGFLPDATNGSLPVSIAVLRCLRCQISAPQPQALEQGFRFDYRVIQGARFGIAYVQFKKRCDVSGLVLCSSCVRVPLFGARAEHRTDTKRETHPFPRFGAISAD